MAVALRAVAVVAVAEVAMAVALRAVVEVAMAVVNRAVAVIQKVVAASVVVVVVAMAVAARAAAVIQMVVAARAVAVVVAMAVAARAVSGTAVTLHERLEQLRHLFQHLLHHLRMVERRQGNGGAREQEVAGEHGRLRREEVVDGGASASCVGAIEHVVMESEDHLGNAASSRSRCAMSKVPNAAVIFTVSS
jgi:hypothetical protein